MQCNLSLGKVENDPKTVEMNYDYVSALIKCLRRGLEEKAMYFALKIDESNPFYLWRRLIIFASEDVSIANNNMAILVHSLYESAKMLGLGKGDAKELVTHAVLALCRTEKTRLNDFVIMEMLGKMKDPNYKIDVPDFAYDKHTLKGKMMGRGMDYFLEEGSKENNVIEVKSFVRSGSNEEKQIIDSLKVGNINDLTYYE